MRDLTLMERLCDHSQEFGGYERLLLGVGYEGLTFAIVHKRVVLMECTLPFVSSRDLII